MAFSSLRKNFINVHPTEGKGILYAHWTEKSTQQVFWYCRICPSHTEFKIYVGFNRRLCVLCKKNIHLVHRSITSMWLDHCMLKCPCADQMCYSIKQDVPSYSAHPRQCYEKINQLSFLLVQDTHTSYPIFRSLHFRFVPSRVKPALIT